MPRLIFVSGASGGGKTETIATLSPDILRIEADRVQFEAVQLAFPFVRAGREYDWWLWPRDPSTLDLVKLLETVIAATLQQSVAHRGHVVAEGAILVNEWFRLPFQQALVRLGLVLADAEVSCLFLDPPPAVLLHQIHRRAHAWPTRRHEASHYPNLAAVERLRHQHVTQLAPGRWAFVKDAQSLSGRLHELLA